MSTLRSNGSLIGNSSRSYVSETTYKTPVFVGGAVYSGAGSTTDNRTYSLTSLTKGISDAPSKGDLVVVAYVEAGVSDEALDLNATFTEYLEVYQNATNDLNVGIYYKFMGDTPDTQIVHTPGQGASTNGFVLGVQVWRNISPSVLGASAYLIDRDSSSLDSPPTLTSTTYSRVPVVVIAAVAEDAGATLISTTNLNAVFSAFGNDSYDALLCMGYGLTSTAGSSYTPSPFTVDTGLSLSDSSGVFLLELAPDVVNSSGVWDLNSVYKSKST